MTIYQPSEDTYLLRDYLKENIQLENKKFLEIGTGNGEIALLAAQKNAEVTASDINREALQQLNEKAEEKGLNVEIIYSDLFEDIEGLYDVIVFNPPYLPGEKGIGDEEIWRGGEKGIEVTKKFLDEVEEYLAEEGRFYIVASSLAEIEDLIEEYDLKKLDEKQLWFETLYILGK
ncbi:HemK2/MTQ2 family protein methyltransferase [Candidatus Nanohalovita haloferacivicina]|uniref:HemK2/MTQ2 family protein methyltransferase n=1 Tax=Candidatus Nanohalovita haloferacivicina TaxID=2978046 RepID=UPI00325FD865|nr:Release factor glutamine methyltransferase [Candidatus Nanohalobia archaeon BNXNv]